MDDHSTHKFDRRGREQMIDSPFSAPVNDNIQINDNPASAETEIEHIIQQGPVLPEAYGLNEETAPVMDQLNDNPNLHESETPLEGQHDEGIQQSSKTMDQPSDDAMSQESDTLHSPEEYEAVYQNSSNEVAKHHDDDSKKEKKKKKKAKKKAKQQKADKERKQYKGQTQSPSPLPPFQKLPPPSVTASVLPQKTIPLVSEIPSATSIISSPDAQPTNDAYDYSLYEPQPSPPPVVFTVVTRAAETTTVYIHNDHPNSNIRIGMGIAPPVGPLYDEAVSSSATMSNLSTTVYLCSFILLFIFSRHIQ